MPQVIGQVKLKYSNNKGSFEILCLKNVFYIPETGVNLISQGQIYWKCLHPLSIIDNGICINKKSMFARLIKNNLYIMDIASPSGFTFPFINDEILKT